MIPNKATFDEIFVNTKLEFNDADHEIVWYKICILISLYDIQRNDVDTLSWCGESSLIFNTKIRSSSLLGTVLRIDDESKLKEALRLLVVSGQVEHVNMKLFRANVSMNEVMSHRDAFNRILCYRQKVLMENDEMDTNIRIGNIFRARVLNDMIHDEKRPWVTIRPLNES